MDKIESLNHTKWDCKYHVVFIPKGRRKVLYGQLRKHLGEVFRGLAQHKESQIEEVIRNYIGHQDKEDERLEQLGLWR